MLRLINFTVGFTWQLVSLCRDAEVTEMYRICESIIFLFILVGEFFKYCLKNTEIEPENGGSGNRMI